MPMSQKKKKKKFFVMAEMIVGFTTTLELIFIRNIKNLHFVYG